MRIELVCTNGLIRLEVEDFPVSLEVDSKTKVIFGREGTVTIWDKVPQVPDQGGKTTIWRERE